MKPLTNLSPDLIEIAEASIFECLLQKIQTQCEVASSYARDYDYDEHSPYNGVRLFLKYIQEYYHAVHALLVVQSEHFIPDIINNNDINSSNETKSWISSYFTNLDFKSPLDKHIYRMARIPRHRFQSMSLDLHKIGVIILRQIHVMHALHTSIKVCDDPYSNEITPERETFILLQRETWINEDIKCLFTPELTLWWLDDFRRTIFSFMRQLLLFGSTSTSRSLNSLVNSNFKRDLLHNLFFKSSSRALSNLISWANDSRMVRLCLRGKHFFTTSATCERIQLPRQSKHGFNCDTRDLCKSHAPSIQGQETTVECLLVYHGAKKSLEGEKNLIIHIHGSAFCVTEPLDHSGYLDPWSKELNVPYLAPKYSKAPAKPFPHAVQDNLDVYLFVTDEQNRSIVKEKLGFIPENIILSGDSSGGNAALSLMIAIAELNRYRKASGETKMIPLPSAIVLQYATSTPVAKHSMSRLLTVFDPFLCPANTFFFALSYLKPETLEDMKEPLFRKHPDQTRSLLLEILQMMNNPFISPMDYKHLDEFSAVPCFVQASEFDILLDDSIEIARRWKGPVTLDVVPEATHGFMAGPLTTKIQQHVAELLEFKRRHLVAK